LIETYRRSLPAFEFTTPLDSPAAFATCDSQLPIGSLPCLFRPDAASFARQPRALLVPDAARVEEMRAALGPGKWIAISWRSLQKGARQSLAERKSIPLEHFARLAEATGARLLDIQYGDVAAERSAFEAQHPGMLTRIDGLDLHGDLEGVMAAIAACDSVVTASNAVAHLAGAIGKRAFVVYLRGYPPFHYWAPDPNGRSPWYPSVEVPTDAAWTHWDQALQLIPA
jgi:ADP-heptose:LPS heptosyltransferase